LRRNEGEVEGKSCCEVWLLLWKVKKKSRKKPKKKSLKGTMGFYSKAEKKDF